MSEGRLLDLDRLEAALEGGVLFEVLAVLIERRRTDRLELAAGEHRLQDRGGVDRPFGGTRTHERVELVDEQDDVAPGPDLFEDLLQPLLEVAPVPATGDQRPEVERVELLALERLGDVVLDDLLGKTLDDGGLANARLSDENGVVLRAPGQDLHHALDLPVTTDHGIELVLTSQLRQVAAELVEQWGTGRTVRAGSPGRGSRAFPALVTGEQLDDLLAYARQVCAEAHEDLRGDSLALADQPEEHVLGADVVVAQLESLAEGELEDLLGTRRERRRTGRGRPGRPDRLLDFLANGLK